uniref:Uncharacterized protein n=1 Tax=Microviridae sp. ctemt10 TaxID=2827647 RepID=A0A8S5TM77_9VIRU|nr:MAG TPA: hypothetical protein [Microviridae sp. ctemt10]
MVNKARDTIHRHRPSSLTLDVEVGKHLVRHRTCNSKYTVNIGLILTNPRIRQLRELGILVGKMPDIQRSRSLRAHLTSHAGGLVTIVSPGFLIAKNLIVLVGALGVNLLVQDRLLADIGKDREIVVQAVTTRPETLKALLVSVIIASDHNADYKTMLHKRLDKITMHIGSNTKGGSITKRSAISLSSGILHDLVDINRNTIAAKILRTLKTSIGRGNAEMRLENFNVPSTSSCILLVKLLNLEGHAKLVNSSRGNRAVINRPKVIDYGNHSSDTRCRNINGSLSTRRSKKDARIPRRRTVHKFSGIILSKQRITYFIRKRNNRQVGTLRDGNSYIGALLGSRQRGSEVVVELGSLKGHTAFDNIGDIIGAIGTCKSSVIHRDVERVRKVLITEPLVHNEGIGTERQRVDR